MIRFVAVVVLGFGTALGFCTACDASRAREASPSPRTKPARPVASVERASVASSLRASVASSPDASANPAEPERAVASSLQVKRFVVATGVKDREPLPSSDPLLADGSAIYAFAELTNSLGDSENVRITFERKGGAERVGNVTLPIPARVSRHRTWAMTRFIRAPGVWDAVLWSESGTELGRTSFEVAGSS